MTRKKTSDRSPLPPEHGTVRNDKGSVRAREIRSDQKSIRQLLEIRLSRRDFSSAAAWSTAAALMPAALYGCAGEEAPVAATGNASTIGTIGSLTFDEVPMSLTAEDVLPAGYSRQVVIRWGDPLLPDAPPFDPASQTRASAERQFGYNNDFLAYLPMDWGNPGSDHGLLVVNHEYPLPHLMFEGLTDEDAAANVTESQVDVTMAAVGLSVVEVVREGKEWRVVGDSAYNRRVSMFTPIEIRGPSAGHKRMQTSADPAGTTVIGTHDNCNGGVTPWGTVLSCEEGSSDFIHGDYTKSPDREHLKRYYYDAQSETGDYGWGRFHRRLDFNVEMNEPNRFEWVVEIDPYEPDSAPVKRTALGRFAHEAAHTVVNSDGRVVVFLSDDWEYEYVYRFVTHGKFDPLNRSANKHLLDEGVLSVGRFNEDGSLVWLPLIFGEGPLTEENGFADMGDLLIQTRRAADLLGATPMDAPEGFVSDPRTGAVYIALTQNSDRQPHEVSAANPRANNEYGHMLELFAPKTPDGAIEFAAETFSWSILVLCGADKEESLFHPDTTAESRFTDPDNLTVDHLGRLWVCTDAGNGERDALYVMDTSGPGRKLSRRFYLPPLESECCSPAFTPDAKTLFVSVQHPGEEARTLSSVVTRWPAEVPGHPPRPSVIAISRDDGGVIGA